MKTSRFVVAVDRAIKDDKLREPFRASDLRRAVKGFTHDTHSNFPPKHRRGNPRGYKEYFEQIEPGLYRRLRN